MGKPYKISDMTDTEIALMVFSKNGTKGKRVVIVEKVDIKVLEVKDMVERLTRFRNDIISESKSSIKGTAYRRFLAHMELTEYNNIIELLEVENCLKQYKNDENIR